MHTTRIVTTDLNDTVYSYAHCDTCDWQGDLCIVTVNAAKQASAHVAMHAAEELENLRNALTEMTQAWHSVSNERDSLLRVQAKLGAELDRTIGECGNLYSDNVEMKRELAEGFKESQETDADNDRLRTRIRQLLSLNVTLAETADDYSGRLHEETDKRRQAERMVKALTVRCAEHMRGRKKVATAYMALRRLYRAECDKRRQAETQADMAEENPTIYMFLSVPNEPTETWTHTCASCGMTIEYGAHAHGCPAPDAGSSRVHSAE